MLSIEKGEVIADLVGELQGKRIMETQRLISSPKVGRQRKWLALQP